MPVFLQVDSTFPLGPTQAEELWEASCQEVNEPVRKEETITVRSVSEQEIQALNHTYRQKDVPTNVLTFSYGTEHDVALCLVVVEREAEERNEAFVDYTALVMVHAFLHALGLDHEEGMAEAARYAERERTILKKCGYAATSL